MEATEMIMDIDPSLLEGWMHQGEVFWDETEQPTYLFGPQTQHRVAGFCPGAAIARDLHREEVVHQQPVASSDQRRRSRRLSTALRAEEGNCRSTDHDN